MKYLVQEDLLSKKSHLNLWLISVYTLGAVLFLFLLLLLLSHLSFADATMLPGDDMSSKMESAGTLLRFVDTGLFKWGARVFAGLCIFGTAWNLKEGRYGPALISLISAILFGTAPMWVRNIFSASGSDSVFSMIKPKVPPQDKTTTIVVTDRRLPENGDNHA